MQGFGTDERGVFQVLASIPTQAAWEDTCRNFKDRHPEFKNGDLAQALRSELSDDELARVE
eukprot:gene46510-37556_t